MPFYGREGLSEGSIRVYLVSLKIFFTISSIKPEIVLNVNSDNTKYITVPWGAALASYQGKVLCPKRISVYMGPIWAFLSMWIFGFILVTVLAFGVGRFLFCTLVHLKHLIIIININILFLLLLGLHCCMCVGFKKGLA